MGVLRRRIAEGTATPGEIEAAERDGAERQAHMQARLLGLVDDILAHRSDPMILQGLWAQFWSIVETARERGVPDGDFHPEIAMFVGGGLKGVSLPDDYREQIQRFFGINEGNLIDVYGMQEMAAGFPRCRAGRYHRPPWAILLVLDKAGETLLNPSEGEVDGRMAYFDLSIHGRWGGLISGDRIRVDFSPCPCGRPSPTVKEIVRYMDLPEGDDKLTCSATVESYVRGAIAD
jgi:phenylacetate-coenzyme A ligase PaaK-like adenylate-forming protein